MLFTHFCHYYLLFIYSFIQLITFQYLTLFVITSSQVERQWYLKIGLSPFKISVIVIVTIVAIVIVSVPVAYAILLRRRFVLVFAFLVFKFYPIMCLNVFINYWLVIFIEMGLQIICMPIDNFLVEISISLTIIIINNSNGNNSNSILNMLARLTSMIKMLIYKML